MIIKLLTKIYLLEIKKKECLYGTVCLKISDFPHPSLSSKVLGTLGKLVIFRFPDNWEVSGCSDRNVPPTEHRDPTEGWVK